jgi:flagellar biosynthesis/type III secretory pathway M-ring protein FliF/YscJ
LQTDAEVLERTGPQQKVSLIVVSALVMAGMAGLVMWSGQPDMKLLYGGLDTKDMADVVHALDEQAIPYEIRNGASVYVPSDYVHKVRMDLASRGLPSGGGIGFEIFDRTSFGISDFVQRTNYNRAVQGELQRTISQLRGVRSARVMIVIPQNRLLVNDQPVRSTASVMVDTGGLTLESDAVNSIRFPWRTAWRALAVNYVVVVDAKALRCRRTSHRTRCWCAASGHSSSAELEDTSPDSGDHAALGGASRMWWPACLSNWTPRRPLSPKSVSTRQARSCARKHKTTRSTQPGGEARRHGRRAREHA